MAEISYIANELIRQFSAIVLMMSSVQKEACIAVDCIEMQVQHRAFARKPNSCL
jgi:hypothetical protein